MGQKQKLDWLNFDFWILVIFFTCLFMAVATYYQESVFTVTKRGSELLIDDNTHFLINYKIDSSMFSAQNEIIVTVDGWAMPDFIEKHEDFDNTNMIFIYFLGSSTPLDQKTEDGVFGPLLIMVKGEDGRFHGGPYEIRYQEEGEKCVIFSLNKLPYAPDSCQETQTPLLTISSLSDTLQYDNNRIVLAFTWVIVGFTLISVRDPLRIIMRKFVENSKIKPNTDEADK